MPDWLAYVLAAVAGAIIGIGLLAIALNVAVWMAFHA